MDLARTVGDTPQCNPTKWAGNRGRASRALDAWKRRNRIKLDVTTTRLLDAPTVSRLLLGTLVVKFHPSVRIDKRRLSCKNQERKLVPACPASANLHTQHRSESTPQIAEAASKQSCHTHLILFRKSGKWLKFIYRYTCHKKSPHLPMSPPFAFVCRLVGWPSAAAGGGLIAGDLAVSTE